jgi:hypothetical protein
VQWRQNYCQGYVLVSLNCAQTRQSTENPEKENNSRMITYKTICNTSLMHIQVEINPYQLKSYPCPVKRNSSHMNGKMLGHTGAGMGI